MSFLIRDAVEGDLQAILHIEQSSFTDAWTTGMLRTHLHGARNIFVVAESIRTRADAPAEIIGFAIAHVVGDEAEVLDIAVLPSERGRGIGAALLDTLMGRCEAGGAATIFLEVRESNTPARALYASRHFALAGRRKRYYQLPTEDGLILRADFPVPTGNPVKMQ